MGYQAEQAMLVATNDINTHKGANFSFAVILGAIGWHMQQRFIQRLPLNAKQTEQILDFTGELTHDLIKEDFHDLARKTHRTHGEELFDTWYFRYSWRGCSVLSQPYFHSSPLLTFSKLSCAR